MINVNDMFFLLFKDFIDYYYDKESFIKNLKIIEFFYHLILIIL
jgi:hypothetical protein